MSRVVPRLASLLLVVVCLSGRFWRWGPRASADEYSDATLEAFVSAAIEVSRRIETWRPLIEGTADKDERDALIEDAQADLARAIEETGGIGEDEYHEIYAAAREDEALRGRIDRIFRNRRQRRRAAGRRMAGR